jgi:hypothetical protein
MYMMAFERKLSVFSTLILLSGWLLFIASVSSETLNQNSTAQYTSDSAKIEVDSMADGPHVYWQSDSSAIVFYLCNDSIVRQNRIVSDTLRFMGLCSDSLSEYVIPAIPDDYDPHAHNNISRIMALSDIHGEYEHLCEILVNSNVVDDRLHWIWGDGHLVFVGDVFDRGDKVTECLWLIYRLESEAKKDGGRVHFLLGNHELMVLRGDDRYIHEKYLNGIVKKSRIAHKDLFGPDMVLGRWLRTRPVAIEINDIVFVHGGISNYLTDKNYDLNKLNLTVREKIDTRSSQLAFDDEIRFLFGSKGPFWYRGYHYEMEGRYPFISPEKIEEILGFLDGETVVVGHTEVDRISSLHGGRVMAIDVPVDILGGFQALLWDGGEFYIVTAKGEVLPVE